MNGFVKLIGGIAVSASLAACSTSEVSLDKNKVLLSTHAEGTAFIKGASARTMVAAADATLARGYTHFRLQDRQINTGGVNGASVASYGGLYSGFAVVTPTYAPTADIRIVVVMYNAGEAGARGAYDAAEVKRQGGKF